MKANRSNKDAKELGRLARLGIGIAAALLVISPSMAAGPLTDVPDPDDDPTYDVSTDVPVVNFKPMGGPCLGCIDVDLAIARGLRAQQKVEWLLRRNFFQRQASSYLQSLAEGQQRVNRLLLNLRALREPPD